MSKKDEKKKDDFFTFNYVNKIVKFNQSKYILLPRQFLEMVKIHAKKEPEMSIIRYDFKNNKIEITLK